MNISFKVSAIGQSESINIEGTLVDLILRLPSLHLIASRAKYFPPLDALNDLLMVGELDEGMSGGCFWDPFQIDNNDYDKLIEEVEKKLQVKFLMDDQLHGTKTYKKWWKMVMSKHKRNTGK